MENLKRMPTVYVVQTPSRASVDMTPALMYGRIQFLIEDPKMQPSLAPGRARRMMEDNLAGFEPGIDYLASVGGDPVGTLILGQILQEWWPRQPIRFLRYDRGYRPNGSIPSGYMPVLISQGGGI